MYAILKKIFRKFRIWKYVFREYGINNFVSKTVILYKPENIYISNNCIINEYVLFNAREK